MPTSFHALLQPCLTKKLSLSLCVSDVQDHSSKKKKNTKRNLSPHFSEQIESPELDPFLKRPVSSCDLGGSPKLEGGPASRVRVVSWAGQASPGADLPVGAKPRAKWGGGRESSSSARYAQFATTLPLPLQPEASLLRG